MEKKNEIVLFETEDKRVSLPVALEDETVWLSQTQMMELFERDHQLGEVIRIMRRTENELSGTDRITLFRCAEDHWREGMRGWIRRSCRFRGI